MIVPTRTSPAPVNSSLAAARRSEWCCLSSRRAAFSIVEVTIVLLVMGILAAVATPTFFRSLAHHQLESAARRVKLDLEQSRHTARVKSRPQTMTFTTATTYELTPDVPGLDRSGATYSVDLAEPPYDLEGATVNFGGSNEVAFDGYGTASASGTVVLELGDQTRTVALDSASGEVTISNP